MSHFSCSLLRFVARVLFAGLFLLSGITKLLEPSAVENYMAAKGLHYTHTLLYVSAAIEIIGALLILFGFWTRAAATVLAIYLAIVTLTMHNFWAVAQPESGLQFIEFLKNLGVLGGLLYIISSGPGHWALCNDKSCSHR